MPSWFLLTELAQLETIAANSFSKPQLIFKHSVSCGTSAHARERLEMDLATLSPKIDCYYLDLLAYRPVSNQIAAKWNIPHQSPQVLLIRDGKVIYHASHQAINVDKLLSFV